ncbi:MAG: hypothetical protein M5R41_07120 [Bacteroidia bacterium]|nr:hypothetical protein [Bacteroidia bacterium]
MRFHATPVSALLASNTRSASATSPVGTATANPVHADIAKNILKHIPGEASGFYLMAVDSITDPSQGILWLIFTLALILLLVVRWLAGASIAVIATTVIAFLIWMFILDNGVLHVVFPDFLPDPLGLIIALFYSALITLVAGSGRIS